MLPPDPDVVRGLFKRLHVWKRFDQRAPNKPLLALWSIGRCINGQPRLVPFQLVEKEVGELIREFGHPGVHVRAEYPFWRLRNDRVWEVTGAKDVRETGSGDAFRQDLSNLDVLGGFPESIYINLRDDPSLAMEIAYSLARAHFPPTRQEEVLEAAGIGLQLVLVPKSYQYRRDSEFRRVVLSAYEFGCALCGFAVRLDHEIPERKAPIALDAAHIKWHQARGPATVQNGIALCALHHRLFDYGAFTLSPHLTVVVAQAAHGIGSEEWLWRFAGQPLPADLHSDSRPDPAFLDWHLRNVFRDRASTQRIHRP